jgi:hypothetical protein
MPLVFSEKATAMLRLEGAILPAWQWWKRVGCLHSGGLRLGPRNDLAPCDAREQLEAEFRAVRHRCSVWQIPGGITAARKPSATTST